MENLSNKTRVQIIDEIAQHLDMDCVCYFEPATKMFVNIPSMLIEEDFDGQQELWQQDIDAIKNPANNFIEIEPLYATEAYRIMESFVQQLPPSSQKERLQEILENKKPFRHFNAYIHASTLRQEWFDYKHNQYKSHVKDILDVVDFKV